MQSRHRPTRLTDLPAALLVFVGCLALSLGLSWANGSFDAEFWGTDEAAHYVTGLLAFDYLRTPSWPPLEFARTFYEHYPKVAIGHWPPLLYVIQGAWMAAFSESRASLLGLMAFLAAIAGLLTFRLWRRELGWIAVAISLLFIATPESQSLTHSVMAEMLLVCFVLVAIHQFAMYLDTESWRSAALFGLFSMLAVLTKPNGLALALVPPFALLFARRLDLVRKRSLYIPALIVVGICAPWYIATFEMAKEGWRGSTDLSVLLQLVAKFNAGALTNLVGPAILGFSIVGFFTQVVIPAGKPRHVSPVWAVAASWALSVFVFHSFIAPVREPRHLLIAVPAILGLAAGGALGLGQWLSPSQPRWTSAAIGSLAVFSFFAFTFEMRPKEPYGAEFAVTSLLALAEKGDRILVSTMGPEGEGAAVSEIAMHDRRPGLRVLRATKLLAQSSWDGAGYRQLVDHPDDLIALMSRESIDFLVAERAAPFGRPDPPHHRLVLDALRSHPELFVRISEAPKTPALSTLDAYRFRTSDVGESESKSTR